MRSTRLLISLTLSIGLAKGIAAQAHGATTAGSFTDAQSLRGRRIFGAHCASCHGAELEGAIGPALAGSTFRTKWNGGAGRSTAELFHLLSTTMPKPAMGSLAPAAYLDVLAYLLHRPLQGLPFVLARTKPLVKCHHEFRCALVVDIPESQQQRLRACV